MTSRSPDLSKAMVRQCNDSPPAAAVSHSPDLSNAVIKHRREKLSPAMAARSMYRQHMFGLFLDRYIPSNQCRFVENTPWMYLLTDISSPSPTLDSSILALSAVKLAYGQNNKRLAIQGYELYIEALQGLNKALSDPVLVFSDETLAATIILILCEAYQSPAKALHSWLDHQEGYVEACSRRSRWRYRS